MAVVGSASLALALERADDPRPRAIEAPESPPAIDSRLDAARARIGAQDVARAPSATTSTALDAASLRAIERGLEWLAARASESPDGSLPAIGISERDDRGFASVAIDALAALAWMGDGSTPERGPHGRVLARTIDRLLARCELDTEAAAPGYVSQDGDGLSRMHGHGFATLALAEAWTMSPRTPRGARIAEALPEAVRCIETSQGLEGGWWYEPRKALEHEGSITITMAQALRAARSGGVQVRTATIARAVEYVKRSQKDDGSFRYALGDPASSVALTAAALSTLQATGTYGGKELDEGSAWLFRALEARTTGSAELASAPNPLDPSAWKRDARRLYCAYYERLYVAQCLWQHAEPDVYERWARVETPRVIVAQKDDGSWHDPQFGDAYATAMSCLVLEIPLGLLPAFQR